jgi:hypothetical protein
MIDLKTSPIPPPPTLEDILSAGAEKRLGAVDFTARLAPEPEPEQDPPAAAAPVGGPDARARAVEPDEAEPDDDLDDEDELVPEVLPVAHLEPDDEEPEPLEDLEEAEEAENVDELEEAENAEEEAEDAEDVDELEEPVEVEVELLPELHEDRPSVDEIAASVIARMRATEDAARRHVEAIEAEAARRCELITAQAELDAELIRLHARREAHAIITAARMRTGGGTGSSEDSQRLHEIGETFSRFAESLETTAAPAPGTHDRPLKP